MSNRVNWVDYAKGLCIFAVVCLYASWISLENLGTAGWMQYWVEFATPFRMPDFFLLSGLFLARVIDRPWQGYIDKKFVHYIYFFALWSFIHISLVFLFNEKRSGDGSLSEYIKQLWWAASGYPFKMMWFIQMLPVYFVITKLIRKVPVIGILLVASYFHAFPLPDTGKILIDEFFNRYIFFYVGYIAAPHIFKLAEWFDKRLLISIVGLIVWIAINGMVVFTGYSELPFISLMLGLLGALGIILTSVIVRKLPWTEWIEYLGKHSIVVYLAFYWPTKWLGYQLQGMEIPWLDAGTYTLLNTLFGIIVAVAFYWIVRRIALLKYLFERPQLLVVGEYKKEQKPE